MEYTEDEFEEYITEIFGTFKIGTLTFDAGKILRELDPIVFRCGFADRAAEETEEAE